MDFNVRRAAIRFLTALLTNCPKALQEIILESGPMGVSKLIDLLQDEREVIRNDVNALVFIQLVHLSHSLGTSSSPNSHSFEYEYSKNRRL